MTKAKAFKLNVQDVLDGKLKFKGLFGKQFKWSDFLLNGAKMIKKLPAIDISIGGTNPNR